MKLLLPGNAGGLLGMLGRAQHPDVIGWLVTPRRSMSTKQDLLVKFGWAADNECFSLGTAFDFNRYIRFLERAKSYPVRPYFVTVPDVVANAMETARRWDEMAPRVRQIGMPLAYVTQDGLEELPAVEFDALFIGGSTEYKLSQTSARLARLAKERGKWVHMGRVNSMVRMRHAHRIGVDSIDGTGWAKSPMRHLRWALAYLRHLQLQETMKI